jgi:23S rRNA G2069 N7-methylase RlmK/C1962 C5-methylase RlmI
MSTFLIRFLVMLTITASFKLLTRTARDLRVYKTNPNRINRHLRTSSDGGAASSPVATPSPSVTSHTTLRPSYDVPKDLVYPTGVKDLVVLAKGKAKLFQNGNPLIYGGAVDDKASSRNIEDGDEVLIVDSNMNMLGRGVYNKQSQYRVRVLARSYEDIFNNSLEDLLVARFEQSIKLREALNLIKDTSENEEVFRLCNGEGDRLSGLVIDVLGPHVVIQASALWCMSHRVAIENAIHRIKPGIGCTSVIWKVAESRLRQDGYEQELEDESDDTLDSSIVVKENDCVYRVDPQGGQKTGFYCDQRDNRANLRQYCKDKTVLDTFCYSGGFSISALKGQARLVTAVDSSEYALKLAKENMKLNGYDLDGSKHIELVKDDAIKYMKTCADQGRLYDIVICDPPKLAPSRSTLPRAINKYLKINTAGLKVVNSGGLFMTCTCSGAMSQNTDKFFNMLHEAAKLAKKEIKILSVSNAAKDHPVQLGYRESNYLTAVLCQVI